MFQKVVCEVVLGRNTERVGVTQYCPVPNVGFLSTARMGSLAKTSVKNRKITPIITSSELKEIQLFF